jgi:hypothetical protein
MLDLGMLSRRLVSLHPTLSAKRTASGLNSIAYRRLKHRPLPVSDVYLRTS